jgi:hypothetical protein
MEHASIHLFQVKGDSCNTNLRTKVQKNLKTKTEK